MKEAGDKIKEIGDKTSEVGKVYLIMSSFFFLGNFFFG